MAKKLTKAQENDKYMAYMRSMSMDVIFIQELPYPESMRNCQLILAKQGNLIYIRDEV